MRKVLAPALIGALLAGTAALATTPARAADADTASALSPAPILTTPDARDVWTHAEPEVARVTHVSLDLDVDFTSHTLSGTATLDVLARPDARQIVLDVKDLAIAKVTDAAGKPLSYVVGPKDNDDLGSAMTVQLDGAKQIRVTYRTSPKASALQWLPPEMTFGKKKPYLHTPTTQDHTPSTHGRVRVHAPEQ